MPNSLTIGQQMETRALTYLQHQGLQLICRNYRWAGGEIDLIMWDQRTLVFIEVRYRRSVCHGSAVASVTYAKQQKIIRTATHYLRRFNKSRHFIRFDIIGITKPHQNCKIDWIKNAFQVEFYG